MNSVVIAVFAVFILLPFVITLAIIVSMRKKGRALSAVMGYAADWTTPLLFISVYIIGRSIFGEGIALYLAGIALIIAIIYAVFERFRVKEFRIVRLLRKVWRLFFLVLSTTYLILLMVGIILKVIEYTA